MALNPVLVSISVTGKRRKRSAEEDEELNTLEHLDFFGAGMEGKLEEIKVSAVLSMPPWKREGLDAKSRYFRRCWRNS